MKIFTWILTILSILAIPAGLLLGYFEKDLVFGAILGVIFYLLLSYATHQLSVKIFNEGGKIPFYISFIGYFIPLGVMYIIVCILSFLDRMVYIFTRRHYVIEFIEWCKENLLYQSPKNYDYTSTKDEKEEPVYIVNGRKLKYLSNCTDYDLHMNYNRFLDNYGDCWRSYDGNKTFIKEDGDNSLNKLKKDYL